MSDEENGQITTKTKLFYLGIFGIAMFGMVYMFVLLAEATEDANTRKVLGYNEDGYFCKAVNRDKFYPIEECSKDLDDTGIDKKPDIKLKQNNPSMGN